MSVTLVLPVLNEIAGMRAIFPCIPRELVDQVLVIDGGSTDGTVEYALEHGCEVYRQRRRGLRFGYIEAYERLKGDVVVTFSPDGNSIPELLPALIDEMKGGWDMVIVSRYLAHARSYDDTLATRLGNWLFTGLINTLFRGRYTDAMVVFRAFRRTLPVEIGLMTMRSPFYERWIGRWISWEPQMSVRCAKRRLRVTEIPGDEPPRIADGTKSTALLPRSRINHYKAAVACLVMFLDDFLRWRL